MKRRGRGEGAVYQRADGIWTASLSLGNDETGKRKRKTLYASTKGELLEKLRKTQHLADRGQLAESGALTVGQFLEMWLRDIDGTVTAGTLAYYRKHADAHLTPRLGSQRLDKVNALVVRGLYGDLAAAEVSTANIRKIGVTLGVALSHAVSLKLIPHNPVKDVRKPKPEKFEPVVWTGEQLRQFLESTKGSRYHALFVLAADSGARQGELLGIRWQDVDFGAGVVNIVHSLEQRNGEFILKSPKTAAGRRKVTLSPVTIAALNEHRKAALAAGQYAADRPVFCSLHGDWIKGTSFYNHVFLPAVKETGLPLVRFHDLRHSAASILLQSGVDVATVSARLGHGSKVTTLGIYSHCLEGGQDKAASIMGKVIGGNC